MTRKIKTTNIAFIGDIHGALAPIAYEMNKFTDTCFFICGDIGFGFSDTQPSRLAMIRKKHFDESLEKNNNTVVFIRGNHDDPSYWTNNNVIQVITEESKRFLLAQDYDVFIISAEGKQDISVLCVGGGLSMDRIQRVSWRSYWPDELPVYKEIPELRNPDVLACHTFVKDLCPFPKNSYIEEMMLYDSTIHVDNIKESETMSKVLDYYKPKAVYHGHFHVKNKATHNKIVVTSLACDQIELMEWPEIETVKENKKQAKKLGF